ncbi:MAG: SPOR domain-containing protein [Hyphomicrobiaceae bacterium]
MFDAPAIDSTQTPATALGSSKPALPRGYLALWAGLTCVAGAYLTQVSLHVINMPKFVADGPITPVAVPNAALQAELATLRHNLGDFQRDVGRVRAEMEVRKQDAGVIAGLSAIEERMSMTTGLALAKSGAAPVSVAQVVPEATVAVPAAVKVGGVQETAQGQAEPRAIKLAPPALEKMVTPIETGSIPAAAGAAGKMAGQLPKAIAGSAQVPATPGQVHPAVTAAATAQQAAAPALTPIGFGPAVVKAEAKPFAVQLGSGSSLDDIRYNWSILSTQHADTLAKLAPRVTSTGTVAAGQTYDLIAGPVKTAADAKKICKTLATRGMDCKVTPYEGEAF